MSPIRTAPLRSAFRRRPAPTGALAALLVLTLLPGAASAQFPDIRDRLPGADRLSGLLQRLTDREPALTTSLDDATNGVPELDGYSPSELSPLVQMPREPDGTFRLFPGAYHFHPESFCLQAGDRSPTPADGYLWAPLEGPVAPLVRAVLERSYDHPDISQHDLQALLWAVVARTKPENMYTELRNTARQMLTDEEMARLSGIGMEAVEDELLRRLAGELPPEVYRVVYAENEIRRRVSAGPVSYEEMEQVAVLTGAVEGESGPPPGRWSFHPDGYFIRYLPSSYLDVRIQLYLPETFEIERGADGEIRILRDGTGTELELVYDDGGVAPAAWLSGEGTPLRALLLRPSRPGRREGLVGGRWTLENAAVGVSRPHNAPPFRRVALATRSPDPRERHLSDLVDLREVAALVRDRGAPPEMVALIDEAWHGALLELYTIDRGVPRTGLRELPTFDATRGTGVSRNGKQPEALNNRQNKERDDALSRARQATSWISNGSDAVGAVTSPAGIPAGVIHGKMVGANLDFIFDNGRMINDALQGDPPRDDYRELARPREIELPPVPTDGLSPGRAEATRRLLEAGVRSIAVSDAAIVTLDRLGGARRAGDEEWVERQLRLLVHLKREVGVSMVDVGDALERWIAATREDGIEDLYVTYGMIEEAQVLVAAGVPEAISEGAAALGLGDEVVERWRTNVFSDDPTTAVGSLYYTLERAAEGFREIGSQFAALPLVSDPFGGTGGG